MSKFYSYLIIGENVCHDIKEEFLRNYYCTYGNCFYGNDKKNSAVLVVGIVSILCGLSVCCFAITNSYLLLFEV